MTTKPKVSVVFGTRPEAIKLAPVVKAIEANDLLEGHVCVTGQHRQMLDQVLEVFDITPDADLALMRPDQTLAGLTARAIEAIDGYLEAEEPQMVVVQGDTTTVFCAALAAFYRGIPVAHVEAGLRTGDLQHPWPEELNRVLTSRVTRLHFAPTISSRDNLRREGVDDEQIVVTGNTVIDALNLAVEKVRNEGTVVDGLPAGLFEGDRRMVLITGHRRESFGKGFDSICAAIARLAGRFPEVDFVYPVHLNPNVRAPVMKILGRDQGGPANVHLIEPLSYLPFVALMDRCSVILTDSGGVQEEAPTLGKPVLVMRQTTERPEAVEAGTARLVGTDPDLIEREVSLLLTDSSAYDHMARAHNPYGDGRASERIVAALERALGCRGSVASSA